MKRDSSYHWFFYLLWPLLGGVWSAWLGFRGYFQVNLNDDTFAPPFVLGFYVLFAFIGLIAGASLCVLISILIKKLLKYCGVGIFSTLSVVTLVNVLVLWQVGSFVAAKYPGLNAERSATTHADVLKEFVPIDHNSYQNPCLEQPPEDAKERQIWESECR